MFDLDVVIIKQLNYFYAIYKVIQQCKRPR